MEKKIVKKKSLARKIIDWVVVGIFGVLFAFMITYNVVSKKTASSNYGVPSFNGFQTLVVLTDSMEGDYMVGSACFVKKMDPSTFKVGDDLTFYYSPWKSYMDNPIVTHRIRSIDFNDENPTGEKYTFTLGGINKNSEQAWEVSGHTTRDCTNQEQVVTEKFVLGKVVGNSMFVGKIYSFVTSIAGLIIIILIPALYLIISYILDIYKACKPEIEAAENGDSVQNDSASKISNVDTSRLDSLSEKEREKLKQELLEQLMEDKHHDGE